ncbi:LAQU0S01e05666g1_1 [Lachancea quebecensis]|uniref:LAQU0S01e05666g1_1 n=1 Tax=Lachancea quebecensis TaxID=1654605 RepID=A0A0P1KL47_9SACH|nr:LAQU0S01e05666g1_1 [Lachancea quebecensis]
MGFRVASAKVSSRSSHAVSCAVALLLILGFVALTSSDVVDLYGSLANARDAKPAVSGTASAAAAGANKHAHSYSRAEAEPSASAEAGPRAVEKIFSDIRLEISDNSGAATRVATRAEIVRSEVVHGPRNYRPPSADFDPAINFQEILSASPVVLFVDSAQDSDRLRALLQRDYEVSPAPAVVDLEKHSRGAQLETYIRYYRTKPASATAVPRQPPYLFVNGNSVINSDFQTDIQDLHAQNELLAKLKTVAEGNVMFARNNAPSNS